MADEHYRAQVAAWQQQANQRNQQQQAAAQEYQAGINQWRREYDTQERRNQMQALWNDGIALRQERDEAIARGDLETGELRDRDLREAEREYYYLKQQEQAQQPRPADPKMVEYTRRRAGHFQKPGAIQEADLAHQYVTRPRSPNPTPESVGSGQHGMGLQPGTPPYFRAMDNLQQMYGTKNFDPNGDVLPGEHEAARISGLSLDEYRKARAEVQRQGRMSWQERK